MASYLFQSGSCLKRDFYSTLINLLTTAGWTDISTNPLTDYNVLMSPSEGTDKRLVLQLRPQAVAGAQPINTTDYCQFSYRLIGDYIPGPVATPGVFNITLGTVAIIIDGVSFAYAAAPVGAQWNNAATLIPLIAADPVLGLKYTAVTNGIMVKLTQNKNYESPIIPIVTGVGSSSATTTVGVSAAGAPVRSAEPWKPLNVIPGAVAMMFAKDSTTINYKYHVNKNRIIMTLEYAAGIGIASNLIYLGLPDEYYCNEQASKGLVVATTCYNDAGASSVNIVDNTGDMPSLTASTTRSIYCTLSQKNPNASGRYMISEMFYGSSTDGVRGKLSGIFALPNQNVLNGDIVQIGTAQYYVVVCANLGSNAFASLALAVQIA